MKIIWFLQYGTAFGFFCHSCACCFQFGRFLGPFWRIWDLLGTIVDHLGAILGHLGAILGPSWGHLAAILRPSWGAIGHEKCTKPNKNLWKMKPLGYNCICRAILVSSSLFRRSWGHLWAILGRFWGQASPKMAQRLSI